jgi:hypothetical protein
LNYLNSKIQKMPPKKKTEEKKSRETTPVKRGRPSLQKSADKISKATSKSNQKGREKSQKPVE